MNLKKDDVQTSLEAVHEIIDNGEYDVRMFLRWSSAKNKEMLFSFSELNADMKQSFVDRLVKDYPIEESARKELTEFKINSEKTDHLLYCDTSNYNKIDEYINKINNGSAHVPDLTTVRKHLHDVKGYCVQIYNQTDSIYLFGSAQTFNQLVSRHGLGFIGNVNDHEISDLDPDSALIGFPAKTVCIVHGNVCIINNKKTFEDTFGLLAEYKKVAEEVAALLIDKSEFYQGVDTIVKDLARRPVMFRSLASLAKNPNIVQKISNHLPEIKKIKENPKFIEKYRDLQINNDGIVYDPETLPQFLSLLKEEPVQSMITGDEFLAEHEVS